MPPPPTQELDSQWLCVNSLCSAKVMLMLYTASAIPKLSWKEHLSSSTHVHSIYSTRKRVATVTPLMFNITSPTVGKS